MIGLIGVADSDIGESGRVQIRGEYLDGPFHLPVAGGKNGKGAGDRNLTLIVEEVKK